MKTVPTYYANIYVGTRKGYDGPVLSKGTVALLISEYIKDHPMGITVTDTEFYYVDGSEPGIIVGLINYPRFPRSNGQLQKDALDFAHYLRERFEQIRVSIIFPDITVMLGPE
jgi:hypothetical protein